MQKTVIGATLVACLLLGGCGRGKFEPRPIGLMPVSTSEEALARARTNFALGSVALALEDFRKAARIDPGDIRALNGIAACYDRMGRFDLSRIYYERALALAPRDPGTQHNYRLSLNLQGLDDSNVTFSASGAARSEPDAGRAPERVIAQASGNQVISLDIAPAEPAPPAGPHLERISLGEVALVSRAAPRPAVPPAAGTARAGMVPAKRATGPVQARLVWQTGQSSEWEFDDGNGVTSPPTRAGPVTPAAAPRVAVLPRNQPVQLLNAVGRPGLAARYRTYLLAAGWKDVRIADAANRRARSLVLHGAGDARSTATRLVSGLPFRPRFGVPSPRREKIILVLGADSIPFYDRLKSKARKS